MTMPSWEPLYATLKDVEFDVKELRNHYNECIRKVAPKNYRDGDDGYDCLAITSRDGHIHDGISRKSIHENQENLGPSRNAILPTEICYGYAEKLKDRLEEIGLDCYRMRYMRLKNKEYIMSFHRDRVSEEGAWRLHIPIFTNPNCFFQWKSQKNQIFQVHFPSDGRGHLVRVDIPHRALNNAPAQFLDGRVHFICDIYQPPCIDRVSVNVMGLTESIKEEKSKVHLLKAFLYQAESEKVFSPDFTDKLSSTGTSVTGLAIKNIANNSFSMNNNYNKQFLGFGFSKLTLVALALQQIRNGDLDLNHSILLPKDNYKSIIPNAEVESESTVSVLELINRIIHAQSTNCSLLLAEHLFGDIDNYIAVALELFVKAGVTNPKCLQIANKDLKLNTISPWEALKLVDLMLTECPEFFDYGKSSKYKFMGRFYRSSNREFDDDPYKCIFKVKTKNLTCFNGVFLCEDGNANPSKIRIAFDVNYGTVPR